MKRERQTESESCIVLRDELYRKTLFLQVLMVLWVWMVFLVQEVPRDLLVMTEVRGALAFLGKKATPELPVARESRDVTGHQGSKDQQASRGKR